MVANAPLAAPPAFDFPSLDERSVSAPALRGKPAILAFLMTDSLAGQAEADILAHYARELNDGVNVAIVAVEPAERRALVQGFMRFFNEKSRSPILGALADGPTLEGHGPFGELTLPVTVFLMDALGRVRFRRAGVITASEIARALSTM